MKSRKFALSLAMLSTLFSCSSPATKTVRLTQPKLEKISETFHNEMSEKTYRSYMAFAKKFSTFVMETNNANEKEDSLGISIPDAYLCLAISGVISRKEAMDDVLSYLELDSIEDLRLAVKEVLLDLGTLFKNSDGKLMGGYNLNSLWLNPEKVGLVKEKDEELYKDLEEVFDASLYMEALTSKKANDYLKENGIPDMPTPKIELNDDDPAALSAMSVYYCLDYFDAELSDYYKKQFASGTHKMDYRYKGKTESVDYIGKTEFGIVYENEDAYGAFMEINALEMGFFLPKEEEAMPSSILEGVLGEDYEIKPSHLTDYQGEVHPSNTHETTFMAPYFSLDNKISLNRSELARILPVITDKGAGRRLVDPLNGQEMYLDALKQFSVMKFNYDGFYSCSVTIAMMEATSSGMQYDPFLMKLDRPYVFEVTKSVLLSGTISKRLPIVVGEIVTPTYVD